jgi:hypothetical protein
MHALTERDLAGLRSMVVGKPRNGRKPCGPRLFLRSDIEACAAMVHHRQSRGGEAAAHQRVAASEWKANSFKEDAKGNGKTHKWKAWNSPTYHMQQSAAKHCSHITDRDAACVGLSGLNFVGFEFGGT